MKPKEICNKTMWAYFAPDGYLQVRSIGETKEESQRFICAREPITHDEYEKNGYSLKQIILSVTIVKP